MTTAADDRASEDAFEAILALRPVPGGAAGLAAFTGAVRSAAGSPGRPSAALADLLSTGLLTDQSSPSTRTAPTAGTERSRGRTRRRSTVILTALIAKFLSAGAVAQAAAGAGVVVVVVTGAGTAGVLPDDAQTAFSDLTGLTEVTEEPPAEAEPVEDGGSVDPADPALPEPLPVPEPVVEPVAEPVVPEPSPQEEWAEGPDEGQSFGDWVSEGAQMGWATGAIVSQKAQERGEQRWLERQAAQASSDDDDEQAAGGSGDDGSDEDDDEGSGKDDED